MTKNTSLFITPLILVSYHSTASDDINANLIIKATPLSESTLMFKGKPMYLKTFHLVVRNYHHKNKPLELTGFVGCYKAFDDKGKEFDGHTVQADLLGALKGGAKEGEVSFVSDNTSVNNAKFVKWSSQCTHQVKHSE